MTMDKEVYASVLCLMEDILSVLRDADLTSLRIEVDDEWCVASVTDSVGNLYHVDRCSDEVL